MIDSQQEEEEEEPLFKLCYPNNEICKVLFSKAVLKVSNLQFHEFRRKVLKAFDANDPEGFYA